MVELCATGAQHEKGAAMQNGHQPTRSRSMTVGLVLAGGTLMVLLALALLDLWGRLS